MTDKDFHYFANELLSKYEAGEVSLLEYHHAYFELSLLLEESEDASQDN
jgi:beta-galactosidase beta subunit